MTATEVLLEFEPRIGEEVRMPDNRIVRIDAVWHDSVPPNSNREPQVKFHCVTIEIPE
ncbi:hypothetical protein [Sinorhizobium meliloti]|uniref:Head-tail adaptor protein n=1 Tax=Rhizobium meliloti TaxID=382 RepID=A0AAW9TR35_RHIML|nr:hypothetical protein [Sinorhizobium meliloti]MQW33585.1 hypothetical protein [Sinorhizobium meliloti]MQW46083.1 hypothetical protein [Sinorhizobium meliloti]